MNEVRSNFAKVLETYPTAVAFSPKKIKRVLQGLQSQIDRLKERGEEFFSQQKDVGQMDWKAHHFKMDEIKTMLKNCEKYLFFSEKTDFLKKFKEISEESKEILDVLKGKQEEANFLEILNLANTKLSQKENDINLFFAKASEKLKKLKSKVDVFSVNLDSNNILSNITQRIKETITIDRFFTKEIEKSSSFKPEYLENYKTFKKAYTDAFKNDFLLKEYIQRHLLTYEVSSKIKEYQGNIEEKKYYFDGLMKTLKEIGASSQASDFNPEFDSEKNKLKTKGNINEYLIDESFFVQQSKQRYKQDPTHFLTKAEGYQNQKQDFEKESQGLTEIRILVNRLRETLFKKEVPLIAEKIKAIKNDDTLISALSFDEDLKIDLGIIKEVGVRNLQQFLSDIEKKWYQCLGDLIYVENQRELFNTFSDVNENLSLCYFLAKDMYGDLRQAAEDNNSQADHIALHKAILNDNKILSNLIGQSPEQGQTNANVTENLKVKSLPYIKLSTTLKKVLPKDQSKQPQENIPDLSFIAMADCHRIYELKIPDHVDKNSFLFLWNDDRGRQDLLKIIQNQQKDVEKEFKECKENVATAFNDLNKIQQLVNTRFAYLEKALYHYGTNPGYKDCFRTAYFKQNSIGNLFQTAGAYAGHGAIKIKGYFLTSSQQTETNENVVFIDGIEIVDNPPDNQYSSLSLTFNTDEKK